MFPLLYFNSDLIHRHTTISPVTIVTSTSSSSETSVPTMSASTRNSCRDVSQTFASSLYAYTNAFVCVFQ